MRAIHHALGAPQHQHRATDAAVEIGLVVLEIDRGAGAIVLAGVVDGLRAREAAQVFGERLLPRGCEVVCTLNESGVARRAEAGATTRSAAQLELWDDRLEGAVVAIGNAPTALFRLLAKLRAGGPRPAAIIALPVGFVGAAEAKAALMAEPHGVPYLTLPGRLGGSAMAAAAVNALASLAREAAP